MHDFLDKRLQVEPENIIYNGVFSGRHILGFLGHLFPLLLGTPFPPSPQDTCRAPLPPKYELDIQQLFLITKHYCISV